MELLWDGGTKVCSNGPGHMTKMATMPIYGKNLKKSSSPEPRLYSWMEATTRDSKRGQSRNTVIRDRRILCTPISKFLNTPQWRDKTFLLTLTFCPLWAVCPCPGAIYMYKIMKKKGSKIRLLRDYFENCNKWPKWQDVPVDIKISSPRGCQPLPHGYIHV